MAEPVIHRAPDGYHQQPENPIVGLSYAWLVFAVRLCNPEKTSLKILYLKYFRFGCCQNPDRSDWNQTFIVSVFLGCQSIKRERSLQEIFYFLQLENQLENQLRRSRGFLMFGSEKIIDRFDRIESNQRHFREQCDPAGHCAVPQPGHFKRADCFAVPEFG